MRATVGGTRGAASRYIDTALAHRHESLGVRMTKSTTAFVLAAVTAALAACNAPDTNRTTKAPPGANNPTAAMAPLTSLSAPPAPAMRGPVAESGNAVAPGTDAKEAFTTDEHVASGAPVKANPIAPDAQATGVGAQDAAAKAPDTASADAAKDQAMVDSAGLRVPGTGTETSANNPRHGALTEGEASTQMPKAGQANNHSSTALEEDSGRGRKP